METRSWHFIDKSKWGPGAWQEEPDKMQWEDEPTGLPCLIVRGPSGSLCGYVGVPHGHSLYGVTYWDVEVEVHGGLTFSHKCDGSEHGVCHVVGPGEEDDVWWFGFDCAHAGDYSPFYTAMVRELTGDNTRTFTPLWADRYRPFKYVQQEVTYLAHQLARRAA